MGGFIAILPPVHLLPVLQGGSRIAPLLRANQVGRGRLDGDVVEGPALLQDDAETATSIDLIRRRHGLIARGLCS